MWMVRKFILFSKECDSGHSLEMKDLLTSLVCNNHASDFEVRPSMRPKKSVTGKPISSTEFCDCLLSRIFICRRCKTLVDGWRHNHCRKSQPLRCALSRFPGSCPNGSSCCCEGRGIDCQYLDSQGRKLRENMELKWLGRSLGFTSPRNGGNKIKQLLGADVNFRSEAKESSHNIDVQTETSQVYEAVVVRPVAPPSKTRIVDIRPLYQYWGCREEVSRPRLTNIRRTGGHALSVGVLSAIKN